MNPTSAFAKAAADAIPWINKAAQAANDIYQELNRAVETQQRGDGDCPDVLREAHRLATEAARDAEMAAVLLSMAHAMYDMAATKEEAEAKARRKEDCLHTQNAVRNAQKLYESYLEVPNE